MARLMERDVRFPLRLAAREWVGAMAVVLACLVVAGCSTTPGANGGKDGFMAGQKRPSVDHFIVDSVKDEKTGEIRPLTSYKVMVDKVIDPDERANLRENALVGEAVVFGLPGTGDRGAFHEAALKRAAELFCGSQWEAAVTGEVDTPGVLALVRFETPGFPCGSKAGEHIPAIIVPLGDCTDISGGHIYPTILSCKRTGESLLVHPYGRFLSEEIEKYDTYFHSTTREKLGAKESKAEDKPSNDKEADNPPPDRVGDDSATPQDAPVDDKSSPRNMRVHKFLLKTGFVLSRDLSWEETGQEEIALTLTKNDDDLIESIISGLNDNNVGLRVRGDPKHPRRILIVPGLRGNSLETMYDRIRITRFDYRPSRRLHVVADDHWGRILIAGPKSARKLLGKLSFPSQTADKKYDEFSKKMEHMSDVGKRDAKNEGWQASGDFRLIAVPAQDGTVLEVNWSRFQDGGFEGDGRSTIDNDIGALLRLAYVNGCSPSDCAMLVIHAREDSVLPVKIDFQRAPVDVLAKERTTPP